MQAHLFLLCLSEPLFRGEDSSLPLSKGLLWAEAWETHCKKATKTEGEEGSKGGGTWLPPFPTALLLILGPRTFAPL